MSDSPTRLPARPSLEQLQKQAKDLLRQYRLGAAPALERFRATGPPNATTLADAQFVIAREYGFESWPKLKHHIEAIRPPGMEHFQQLAAELAAAYSTGDSAAIRQINWNYGTSFAWDHQPVEMQRVLTGWFAAETRTADLALSDAQRIVAHSYGFDAWHAFVQTLALPPDVPARSERSAPAFVSGAPPFYTIDWNANSLSVRGPQSDRDWDTILAVMQEHHLAKLTAGGITDAAIQRLARLDRLIHLHISDSQGFTDDGFLHLARMPQLQDLELGGPTSLITDRGLEALRHLTALRRFQACWLPGISDSGLANLAFCDLLEDVNLLGTRAGDGTLDALTGKRHLHRLKTGRNVTDAGLALLQQFPIFRTWHGSNVEYSLMSADAEPSHLLIDGPFTNAGLANLAALQGLAGLTFFWHCPAFTAAGLEPLRYVPNLAFLGCQDEHCDNPAMRHIAAIPRLRMLMGQGAVAGDEGFAALSRSQTIEYIWGRECPNLTGRGFTALAAMPALRGLAVSCKNVDDVALSALPRFPALRELMPMDVPDAGFRHIGACENLEALWCMYCRQTGDAATGYIAGLKRLKTYYAGKTQITDRSLEILGRMLSLERLEFWQCAALTDAGIAHLTALPNLREVTLAGLPGITRQAAARFPPPVRVTYSA
jgi:hypothetical protein